MSKQEYQPPSLGLPSPYPTGTVRPGYSSVHVQPLVKQWLENVKIEVARVEMEMTDRISVSMVIEVLLRAWIKLSSEEKVELVRSSEMRTRRKPGRPKGKSKAEWDSHLK